MYKENWIYVKCFFTDPEIRPANLAFRITKKGKVNLRDIKKYLAGTSFKIPIRYTSFGIRELNPDMNWPKEFLYEGDPPEEHFVGMSKELIAQIRKSILDTHPSKMSSCELAWMRRVDMNMLDGTATPADINKQTLFREALKLRPINIDKW